MMLGAAALSCDPPHQYDPDQCVAGDLDRRFCDRTGDLVADRPDDEGRLLDPETLIFAYTPVEDPTQYREVWVEFLDHLEERSGRKVQFFPAQSNAAQIEAMRSGRLHIAGFSTGSLPLAVNCAGFKPVAMMAGEQGDFGYEMEIIVHADSDIESVDQIKGKKFAFTTRTSNSGFKAPTALLSSEFGLEGERDFEVAYSGRHDNSLLGVINGDYDAAAVANEVTNRLFADGVADRDAVRIIYTSETFPTTGFGVAHNLTPELEEAIRDTFFSFDWEGTGLAEEFSEADSFVPISYEDHWSVIRKIDDKFQADYSCK